MTLPLMDVYEEHLDEAAFLWGQWERALVAPDYNPTQTAILEQRLLAHLDGLVVGGAPVAQELLRPALESEEPQRISAAVFAMLAEPGGMEPAEAVGLLESACNQLLVPLQRALELSGRDKVGEALLPLLNAKEVYLQALALEMLAFRGETPHGPALKFLQHPASPVVTAALRGLQPLPQEVLQRELLQLLADARLDVRTTAIEAGLVSGSREAWATCRKVVETHAVSGWLPLVMLALGGNERDVQWLLDRAGKEELQEDVLWALGFSGRVEAVDVCLELMGQKPLAALAGEAFSAITGLKLEGAYTVPTQEEGKSLPSLEEDLEQDLEHRPEDDLPVPDRWAVAAWWQEARKDFSRGIRYLRGRAFSIEGLLEELERGSMRRRHVHALELAIRSQGACVIRTRAFSWQQHAGLVRARTIHAHLSASTLSRLFGG